MAIRLGRVEVNRRAAWVLPAALGVAVTGYLACLAATLVGALAAPACCGASR